MKRRRTYWQVLTGVRHHWRVRRLSISALGLWFICLDLAAEFDMDGKLISPDGIGLKKEDLFREAGRDGRSLNPAYNELLSVGLLACNSDLSLFIPGYSEHQPVLDSSVQRVRSFRERQKNQQVADSCNADVTPLKRSCNDDVTPYARAEKEKEKEINNYPLNPPSGECSVSLPEKIKPQKTKPHEAYLEFVQAIYTCRNDLYATLSGRRADQAPVNDFGEWTRAAKKLADSLKALSLRGTEAYAVPSSFGPLGDDGARDLWLAIVHNLAGDEFFRKNLRTYFNAETLWGVESKIGKRIGLVLSAGWRPTGRNIATEAPDQSASGGVVRF